MSEILDFGNTEKQTETSSEEVPAETLLPEEPAVTEEVPQPAAEDAHAEDTAVPDPFGPVNTGSIPLEVPAAADSGYISPYSAQSAAGIGGQRTDADGEPAGERAGFWPRLAAFLIDAVIATVLWGILLFLFGLFTDRLNEPFFFSIKLRTVLMYVAQKLYFVIAEWKFGKTLGKKALRLEVISSESLGRPGLWTVFFRETFGKFLSSACVVGDLMILGKEHLPLYDRFADTEVVYTVNAHKPAKEAVKTEEAVIPSVPETVQEQETESV